MMSYTCLQFRSDRPAEKRQAEKLRGFFAALYKDNDLFHNHTKEGKVIYRYPLIQYKVIDGCLTVIGVNQASVFVANEFIKHQSILLGDYLFVPLETALVKKEVEMTVTDELFAYRFTDCLFEAHPKNTD
ncbi:MAG: hypothetical protein AB1798_09555 [Spirochaetota bacterium]